MIKSALGKYLLLWFMIIALVPLISISYITYRNTKSAILDNIRVSFTELFEVVAGNIQNEFNRYVLDTRGQADNPDNVKFLQRLMGALDDSEAPLSQFIKSPKWEIAVYEHATGLKDFRRRYGYYDILLMDKQGNVLYSVERESDLGTNLFNGKFANTVLANACRESLKSGQTTFSDYGHYAPSEGNVCAFMVDVVLDQMGEKIGVIALQLPIGNLDEILSPHHRDQGNIKDVYLIGSDLLMRSKSQFSADDPILVTKVDTKQSRLWLDEHGTEATLSEESGDGANEIQFLYESYHGDVVYGGHKTITILGKRFGLIAEVLERDAMAPVHDVEKAFLLLSGVTSIAIILVSLTITGRIVKPINSLSQITKKIAAGDLNQPVEVRSNNEIGMLAGSVQNMLVSLRQNAEENRLRDWQNTGWAQLNEEMRGEKKIEALCKDIISYLCRHLDAQVGTLSIMTSDGAHLEMKGSFAYKASKKRKAKVAIDDGMLGQCAQDKKALVINEFPEDLIKVTSALGESSPTSMICFPVVYEGRVLAVLELASFRPFENREVSFLELVEGSMAAAINAAQLRENTQGLLEESQAQSEELQAQQEELQAANEELAQRNELLEELTDDHE